MSSDRFRVNAHQRRLDVWLVYKCVTCDDTWKLAVVERATPEDIGPSRLEAYHRNACHVAWDCAFDPRLLARAAGRVEWDVPYRLDAEPGGEIALALPRPVRVRLERLLADGLGVSRSQLGDWVARGVVRLEGGRACLRRPASNGQVIRVETGTPSP